MRKSFHSRERRAIRPGSPNAIEAVIDVRGMSGRVRDVAVALDVEHTWTQDLRVFLIAPTGERVLLVSGEGGSGDDFRGTRFDDAAPDSIRGARAPFAGTFRPAESLAALDDVPAQGRWTLRIEDTAFGDGGALVGWTLELSTGSHRFENVSPVRIDPGPPDVVEASLVAQGLGGVLIERVTVTVDVEHTWDADLRMTLVAPDGRAVVLVDRAGGSRDDFRDTVFDDRATRSISAGAPPFTGRFRPLEPLEVLAGGPAGGTWTLRIEDLAARDGGWLRSFAIELETCCAEVPPEAPFRVQVRFGGGLTGAQRSAFDLAAARWSAVIAQGLPSVEIEGEVVDDLLVLAEGRRIDGPGGILGQAGPTHLRPDSLLPARGIMTFDADDLARMQMDGSLVDVIVHEMGHVLGLGTIWRELGLVRGSGGDDPRFVGDDAQRAYGELLGTDRSTGVPLANTGGAGTREGHWRESTFGNELMTGFLNPGPNPLSALTIAALSDMGYWVDAEAADPYSLPTRATGRAAILARCCEVETPEWTVLPPSAVRGRRSGVVDPRTART